MNNILTYEDFNLDLTLSEGISTVDMIEILLDIDPLDGINEGFTLHKRKKGSKEVSNIAAFVPGMNDTQNTNTCIFKGDKKTFNYHKQLLEKSGVMSYNLYKFKEIWINKLLKHPDEFKLGDFTKGEAKTIDEESIVRFFKRSSLYIRSIIKEQNFDVDIITYPSSSSKFNEILTKYVMDGYDGDKSPIKCIPNLFTKDIQTVEVNKKRASELGMSDEEINSLEKKINNWKEDYSSVYPLRLELDRLKDDLILYMNGYNGKRGRRPNAYYECVRQIKEKLKEIDDWRSEHGRRGKDKTNIEDKRMSNVDVNSFDKKVHFNKDQQNKLKLKARGFEIKSMDDKIRKSIENLFTINKGLDNKNGKSIEERLKGKNVVIFDDNISSGATLDDLCLALQKCGVKKILPITLAIIDPSVHGGGFDEKNKFKNRE